MDSCLHKIMEDSNKYFVYYDEVQGMKDIKKKNTTEPN